LSCINENVSISSWREGGMRSTKCCLLQRKQYAVISQSTHPFLAIPNVTVDDQCTNRYIGLQWTQHVLWSIHRVTVT